MLVGALAHDPNACRNAAVATVNRAVVSAGSFQGRRRPADRQLPTAIVRNRREPRAESRPRSARTGGRRSGRPASHNLKTR